MANAFVVLYAFLVDVDKKFRDQASRFMPVQFPSVNLHTAMSVGSLLESILKDPPHFVIANIESMDAGEADQLVEALGNNRKLLVVTWFDNRRKADAEALAQRVGGIAVKKGRFSTVAKAIQKHLAALDAAELQEAERLAEGKAPKSEDPLAPYDGCNLKA